MPASRPPVVLHLISSLNVGGTERLLVWSIQQAMGNPDRRYVVVIMNDGGEAGLLADLEATGVPLYRFNRPEGHLHPKYLSDLLTIIDRHGVGVIHAHNEGSRFWGMLARALRPRLKLVYTVHSVGKDIDYGPVKRFALRHLVDAVVAISPFVEQETRRLAPRRLIRIENGVDLRRFLALPLGRPAQGPLKILSVGRFVRWKGQDVLLEAVRLCRAAGIDMRCTLAGVKADAAFFDEIVALAGSEALRGHVDIVLDRTDVETLLGAHDVFVLPSREEGFGLVVIEALASGLPVVASRAGGAAELVRHDDNGLAFEPGDAPELADRLMQLAGDAALRLRLAETGRRSAGNYDIARTVDDHWRLYSALAG